MFAVVVSGGKQYKVENGSSLSVEKLDANVGDKVELDAIMTAEGAEINHSGKVICEVIRQAKAAKIIVYKYKAKKNVRKRQGHRQPYTRLKVLTISAN